MVSCLGIKVFIIHVLIMFLLFSVFYRQGKERKQLFIFLAQVNTLACIGYITSFFCDYSVYCDKIVKIKGDATTN